MPPSRAPHAEIDIAAEMDYLRHELAARLVECDWLRDHYDRQLRSALSKDYVAASSFDDHTAASTEAKDREIERLRAEVDRVLQAERRYLDRIEELKEALKAKGQ